MMTEGPILWRAVKCARCQDTCWVCETHDDAPPGTASTHAGVVRRACRARRATHRTRIIRRARRGASGVTTAWTTTDDASADPHAPPKPPAMTDEQFRIIRGLLVTMVILLGLITGI